MGLLSDVAKPPKSPPTITSPDSGASSDTAKATLREMRELLEAQTDLIEEMIAEEKPDASAASGSGTTHDGAPNGDEPEPDAPATTVKSDTPPPTPPQTVQPAKPDHKRNPFAGLWFGRR